MSLTSRLKDQKSEVRKFMNARLPNTRRVMALSRGRMGQRPTRRPEGPVPWPLIGTAVDYRLRFYFPQTGRSGNVENLVCYLGAAKACGAQVACSEDEAVRILVAPPKARAGGLDHGLMLDFFASLKDCLDQAPPMRRLDAEAEDRLLRHCVVMGALDFFYRTQYDAQSVLLVPEPRLTISDLLAVAKQGWLDDLRGLSWDFHDGFPNLREQPAALNPTFDGSAFVDGADADLVTNGCLIDFKTTINPLKDAEWIYQLLGYVLLDWHDEHRIERVALYFARQNFLLEWELTDLLAELTGGPEMTLEILRQDWHDMVTKNALSNVTDFDKEFAKNMGYVMDTGRWKRWQGGTN